MGIGTVVVVAGVIIVGVVLTDFDVAVVGDVVVLAGFCWVIPVLAVVLSLLVMC